ncbi:MAG: peptidoglycan editing factor PgeF [Methylococcales bacterium]
MLKNWLEPDWPAPANVHAASTLRSGGVSTGVYSSLNPATHVGDDVSHVQKNRTLITQMLALPAEPAWLEQVHGQTVLKAEQVQGLQQADASFTQQAQVVCAVMTADCLPVLFCSSDGQSVAAAHAGWRGLLAGILTNTLLALQAKEVLVWLGPAIGQNCFEVGAEVREAFVQKNSDYAAAFIAQGTAHYLADIYQLARIELANAGVSKIYGGDFCTVTDQARFFSYRRDNQTGRMATLIWRS